MLSSTSFVNEALPRSAVVASLNTSLAKARQDLQTELVAVGQELSLIKLAVQNKSDLTATKQLHTVGSSKACH